ncbi:MAG: carbohydrate porin [Gammaproteobacteria bacterium]|nr:carbohydrate porin [Gammaproteobacteria bacterium]
MAKFKALPIAAAVATVLVAMSASAVEFHGYMRAGIGQNADGGGQVCYGNGGAYAHAVGRLGDECDMYAELTLGQEVFNRDGKTFGVVSTIAYGTHESGPGEGGVPQMGSQGNSWQAQGGESSSPWEGGRLSVREMYATAKGIIGDSTFWAGKRFGQRKDIHILDFFYLMNSGTGVGFDGLSAGPGKLSFQWNQANTGDGGPAFPDFDWSNAPGQNHPDMDQDVVNGGTNTWHRTNKLDVRYNLPVGSQNIDFVAIYGAPTLTDLQKDNGAFDEAGYLAQVEWTMPILGGFNKLSGTYATNGFADLRDAFWGLNYATWLGEGEGYGVINHGLVKFGKKVEMAYVLKYTNTDLDSNGWAESESYSAVARPMFKWNDVMSTALEVGYDNVDWNGTAICDGNLCGDRHQAREGGEDLFKVTLAQQWSPLQNGGFWARPQFRLFVSNYSGDRAVKEAETMFGAQVEAWW